MNPNRFFRPFTPALLLAVLTGCGTIKHYENLAQLTGRDLETYVGRAIFKLTRTCDLPNVFGKADIYGGKVFRGYTEVRYQGFLEDGKILLRITEVETQSNETAMSRYSTSHGTYNANTHGNERHIRHNNRLQPSKGQH
jgi:hypothetical protein